MKNVIRLLACLTFMILTMSSHVFADWPHTGAMNTADGYISYNYDGINGTDYELIPIGYRYGALNEKAPISKVPGATFARISYDSYYWIDRNLAGNWSAKDPFSNNKIPLGSGPNPTRTIDLNVEDTLTVDMLKNNDNYKLQKDNLDFDTILGWTIVPMSDNNTKLAKQQGYATTSVAYNYVKNNAGGVWYSNWDFWNCGWQGYENNVAVSAKILNGGKKVKVIRTLSFGPGIGTKGYVNAPLSYVYSSDMAKKPAGYQNEWASKYGGGKIPDTTPVDATPINANVEHRMYGLGESVYLLVANGDIFEASNFQPQAPNNTINMGQPFKISATIKNVSTAQQNDVPVQLTFSGNKVMKTIPSLAGGASEQISFDLPGDVPLPSPGSYQAMIEVNPVITPPDIRQVPEATVSNNAVYGSILISIISAKNTMTFNAALHAFDDAAMQTDQGFLIQNPENYPGYSASNPLRIKAGYGIPITVELQGFNFEPTPSCCGDSTYGYFQMSPEFSIESSDLDGFWQDSTHATDGIDKLENFPAWTTDVGPYIYRDNEYMRASLIHQAPDKYPLEKRMIYTNPAQKDGLYTITVSCAVNGNYQEYLATECPGCTADKCSCCCDPCTWKWEDRTVEDPEPVTLYIQIEGSMYDDDQQMLSR